MKSLLAKLLIGMSVVVATSSLSMEARADQIVVRLIQASNREAAPDPKLADLLPDLKRALRWSHYQQVTTVTSHAKAQGTDVLLLGARLKLELTYKGIQGKQLVVDVKLLLDDQTVLTHTAKLGHDHVCIAGNQAGDEAWIIDLQRR